MKRKPDGCRDCPMYQTGNGFVPDELIDGAEVLVVGQNPGADEERVGRPFVGQTGVQLESTYFPVADLVRGVNVSLANVLRCRWNASNDLPTKNIRDKAVACCRQYDVIQPSIRLIVAHGDLAWSVLGNDSTRKVSEWHGFLNEATSSSVASTDG